MRNAFKVARWEFNRNIRNRSFLIGLFLTPAIFLAFMLLGNLFSDSEEEPEAVHVLVHDQLGLFPVIKETVEAQSFNWTVEQTELGEDEVGTALAEEEPTVFLLLDARLLEENAVPVYTNDEVSPYLIDQIQMLEAPLKAWQMAQMGLSEEQLQAISAGIQFVEMESDDRPAGEGTEEGAAKGAGDPSEIMSRVVPGAFAGIVLLSIIFSGMYIFQSASQEKKDKVAEIILSSIAPGDLMQGKIIGYFLLGMVQAVVFLIFAVAVVIFLWEVPVLSYLLVSELLLYLLIAVMGYLLFAALFVGVGATMADVTTAGNFQGLVMMLPFLPFVFIGPILHNPSGLIAQIGSFIPFSAPGVLLLRLTILDEWPVFEIVLALIVLAVSIWIFMKLAGKIFKTGILLYGKNATPKEIWKWIRA